MDPGGIMDTLTARQAAELLGVKRKTLYTYASRGWLRSLPGEDGRQRRYLAAEVEALREQAEATRGHTAVASTAIRWGQPVVDTAISAIGPEGPLYRGVLAVALLSEGFEAVAARLWGSASWPAVAIPDCGTGPLHARLAGQPDAEPPPGAVVRALALAACLPRHRLAAAQQPTIAGLLAVGLGRPDAAGIIDHALILCADHELNASTFAARVVASTGAGLSACLIAGLAALSGHRHGTASDRVEALLDAWPTPLRPPIPGCGHRLYPDGDPRVLPLLAPGADPVAAAALRAAVAMGQPPNVDFGLVAMRRQAGLPRGSAAVIFAIGRLAGFIAHVREERARGVLIRPRARFVG
jgi:citrate synthase